MVLFSNKILLIFAIIFQVSCIKLHDDSKLYLTTNKGTFSAILEKNEIAEDIVKILPLTLDMKNSINGKIYKFSYLLTEKKVAPNAQLKQGDIILYESNKLMILYDISNISENFVKIGEIENFEDFKSESNVNELYVTLSKCDPSIDDCQVPMPNYYAKQLNYLTWKVLSFLCFLFL